LHDTISNVCFKTFIRLDCIQIRLKKKTSVKMNDHSLTGWNILWRFRKCFVCEKTIIFQTKYKCNDCGNFFHRNCHDTFIEIMILYEEIRKSNMKNEVVKRTPQEEKWYKNVFICFNNTAYWMVLYQNTS